MELATHTPHGVDKTTRYGWITKDAPGELIFLHKDLLQIEQAYQRDVLQDKVSAITAAWSWLSLGALVVGERNGEFWVIDGQHRALAAKRRSDITHLPCVVFRTENVQTEARGFLALNTGRKPVTAISKQKALVAAGDEISAFVQSQLDELGIVVKPNSTVVGHLKCISWCQRRAAEDKEAFRIVIETGAELSKADNMAIYERVLEGLWVINDRYEGGITEKRMAKRLREKGARALLEGANRAAAFFAAGGGRVWAEGMIEELNKGLRNKFTLRDVSK